MAHNPIHSQQTLPRFSLSRRLEVPPGMAGVLFHNGSFVQQLRPGDESRRFPGHTFYVVDVSPHSISLSVSAQDRSLLYYFPLQILIAYKVADPQRMVSEAISDTERIVQDGLEPLISQESRGFFLYDYANLTRHLEAAIANDGGRLFTDKGLQLVQPCQISVRADENFLAQARQSRDSWQVHSAAQYASHKVTLPSASSISHFEADVTIHYRVARPADLPKGDHALAESQLWPQVERLLSDKTREYSVKDVHPAQLGANSVFAKDSVVGFGIIIEGVHVRLEMDKKSREDRQQQDAESERRRRELAEQQHRIEMAQQMSGFIEPFYRNEDLELLRIARNVERLDEVADRQEQLKQERVLRDAEAQNKQLEILRDLVNGGAFPDKREEVINAILNRVQQSMPGASKELPATPNAKALNSGEPSAAESASPGPDTNDSENR